MAMDPQARAWQQLTKQIRPALPGEWAVGRSGIRSVLVRLPIEWILTYVTANRSRQSQKPTIWVAQMSLVQLWRGGLSLGHGVTSDRPDGPGGIDLTTPEARRSVEDFITQVGLPRATWGADDFAAAAEAQFSQPDEERGRPMVYTQAAGWRVVLDRGDPRPPALEAAAWLDGAYAPDDAAWLWSLAAAWDLGGRPAALEVLHRNRDEVLTSLKLRSAR